MEPTVGAKDEDNQFLISPSKLNEKAKAALQIIESLKTTTIENISKLKPDPLSQDR